MKAIRLSAVLCILSCSGRLVLAQGGPGEIQSLLAGVGTAMADSQKSLAGYKWIQQTQMLKDGQTKGTTVQQVQIGPDGQPIKITLSSPPPPPMQRGLRGRMMKKEMEETQDYVKRMTSLAQDYVKPNPAAFQQQVQAGKAWLNPSPDGSTVQIKFGGILKDGDSLTLTIDTRIKQIRQIAASSYLDNPQDPIAISALFQNLPDGTDYMAQMSASSQAKGLQVQVVTLNYSRVSP